MPQLKTSETASKAPHDAAPKAQGKKNSEIVYSDLRSQIISMALVPGTPILERELTEKYGVSRTPVREALLRLVEENLVDVAPKYGTFVARIPISVLREAIVARRALEEAIVRAVTAAASSSQIMELRAIIQRQQEMADAGAEEQFHRADDDFHAKLATIARYPGIWDVIQQLRVQVERYRRLTLPQPGRMQMVVTEHAAVIDAVEKRDADAAVSRMNEHLGKLQLDISVFRDKWPDYFIYDPAVDEPLFSG